MFSSVKKLAPCSERQLHIERKKLEQKIEQLEDDLERYPSGSKKYKQKIIVAEDDLHTVDAHLDNLELPIRAEDLVELQGSIRSILFLRMFKLSDEL